MECVHELSHSVSQCHFDRLTCFASSEMHFFIGISLILLVALHLRQESGVKGSKTFTDSIITKRKSHNDATPNEEHVRIKRSLMNASSENEDSLEGSGSGSGSGSLGNTSDIKFTVGTAPFSGAPAASPSIMVDLIGEHDSYLPEGYNKLEIPRKEGDIGPSPFGVWASMAIKSVLDIDELKETMTLQMESVISWYDEKIAEKNKFLYNESVTKTLDILYLDRIWHPDAYLENVVSVGSPKFIGEPVSLRIRPQKGEIFYKARVSPTVKCQFTFVYYPADTQKCHFVLRSYSYQSQELALHWLRSTQLGESVVASFELFIETFDTANITEKFDTLDLTYDTLKFTITARRKLSYHLIQTYLPSSLFIFITWLCFLLPPSMLEARMGIAMTTLLTLTAMFASVRSNAPVVSYVKAIDLFMVVSMFFVFLTLVEFSIMIWIRHNYEKHLRQVVMDVETKALRQEQADGDAKPNGDIGHRAPVYVTMGRFIDRFAVLVYSLMFILFSILYWSWLLIYAEYFSFVTNADNGQDETVFVPPPPPNPQMYWRQFENGSVISVIMNSTNE